MKLRSIYSLALQRLKRAILTASVFVFISILWGKAYIKIESEAIGYAQAMQLDYIDTQAKKYGYVIPSIQQKPLTIREIAIREAKLNRIPVRLFLALIKWESKWNVNAVSSAGAIGLGQVMPANAKFCGISVQELKDNPEANIKCSAMLYRDALRQAGGKTILALKFYNTTPKRIDATPENREYPDNVLSMLD
jgi:soluble lytic murein transglycosylase-like protein